MNPAHLHIAPGIALNEAAIEERFIRASGPGGQNVNKVSTAVELRLALSAIMGASPDYFARLRKLAGRKLTDDGTLVIKAQTHRTQERNRETARVQLLDLLARSAIVPKRRIATRVPKSQRQARRDAKILRAKVKTGRARPPSDH